MTPDTRSRLARRSAAAGLCLMTILVAGPLAADPSGFLHPLGPIAEIQRTELVWATVAVMVAILPVLLGTPFIMWRYRRTNTKATYRPQWHFDTWLEVGMWGLPIVIVAFLGIWLAQATFRIDPYRTIDAKMAEELNIELAGPQVDMDVVGLDWKWLFLYPDQGVASMGEMVMPVGHPVAMRLTTDTVMQAFLVPRIGGQIYAMPRMATRLNLIADREGRTEAINTQYTGLGMSGQRAEVRAVSPGAYRSWISRAQEGPVLDDETYAIIAQSGSVADAREALGLDGTTPILFRLEATDIFDRVIDRYQNPEGVARDAQPGSPTYNLSSGVLPEADQ
ncbi:cytochrome ubiquinol oxidase subunit II [Roseivivax halodurans]|uniref:cytochrome ubiquinol oxidase subunit II n=1 Tax=Roseivivax halodurans TaxID=93683 RepID=UPI0004B24017|nr:cytochrome ubiquinol oxidase subunit II [Roseivivax halodurans]